MGKEHYTYLTPALVTVAACTFGAYLIWKQSINSSVHPANTNEVVVITRSRRTETVAEDKATTTEGKKSVYDSNHLQISDCCETSFIEAQSSKKTAYPVSNRRHSCSEVPKEVMTENPDSMIEASDSDEVVKNDIVTLVDLRQISKPKNEVSMGDSPLPFRSKIEILVLKSEAAIKNNSLKETSSEECVLCQKVTNISDMSRDVGSINNVQDNESITAVPNNNVTRLYSPPSSGFKIEVPVFESNTTIRNESLQQRTSEEYVSRQEVILPVLNESSGLEVSGSETDETMNIKNVTSQELPQTSTPKNEMNEFESNNNVIDNRASHSDDIGKVDYFLGPPKQKEDEDFKKLSSRSSRRRSWRWRESSMYSALKEGNLLAVQSLSREGTSAYFTNVQGQSPIHLAAASGNTELMEILLQSGRDLSMKDMFGYTPFHRAALTGQTETINWLFERGGDYINETNRAGWTALHLAAMSGHYNTSVQLLKLGADVNAKDKDGWTPLYLAKLYKRTIVMELLESWGGVC